MTHFLAKRDDLISYYSLTKLRPRLHDTGLISYQIGDGNPICKFCLFRRYRFDFISDWGSVYTIPFRCALQLFYYIYILLGLLFILRSAPGELEAR